MKAVKEEMKAVKEEMAEEPFVIRPYLKSELAHLYNPYVPLVYAMRKMREWIRNNKELYDAMYSGGEGKNDHAYSARQVRLIVKYLDEPWFFLEQALISYNENKISYNEIGISYNEKKISYNEIKISYNETELTLLYRTDIIIMYSRAGAREYSFYIEKACNWGRGVPPQLHVFFHQIKSMKRIKNK